MKLKKDRHNGIISFWKFMFCLMIVIFHSDVFALNNEKLLMYKGSIGVEFFFLVSGYLLAKSALGRKDFKIDNLGKETVLFIFKKVKNFFPYVFVCYVIGLIIMSIYEDMTIKSYILSIFELLFIKMSGIQTTEVNGVTWYISAMLISMWILYPLLRKYNYNFIYLGCPLIVLLLGGWLSQNFEHLRTPELWTGFVYKGLIRSIFELSLGCILFVVAEKINKVNFTSFGRLFITIVEIIGFLIPFFVCQFVVDNILSYDFVMLLFLSLSVMFAFSEKTYEYKLFNNKFFYHLENLSLPLYLCHVVLRVFILNSSMFIKFNYYEKIVIFVIISIVLSEILLFVINFLKKRNFYYENIKKLFVQV